MRNIRREARRATRLEFDPQYQDLDAILADARVALRSGTRAEKQAARAIIASARAVRPNVKADYGQAFKTAGRADRMLEQDISEGSIFSDAAAVESAGFKRRAGEQRASELTELGHRQLRAKDAQVFNTRALQSAFRGTQAEVAGKRTQLARQEGKALQAMVDSLREEESDDALAGQKFELDQRKFGHTVAKDTMSFIQKLAESATPEERGGLTPTGKRDKRSEIGKAKSWLKLLQQSGLSLDEARDVIVRQIPVPMGEKDKVPPNIHTQYVDQALRQLKGKRSPVLGFLSG